MLVVVKFENRNELYALSCLSPLKWEEKTSEVFKLHCQLECIIAASQVPRRAMTPSPALAEQSFRAMPTASPPLLVHGASARPELVAALRAALAEAVRAMTPLGALPADIVAMTWSARTPAAIHPSRAVVDLAQREILGGVRPAVTIRAADHAGVRVALQLRSPTPPDPTPVWRGLSRAALAQQYSPRVGVPDMGAVFDAWRTDGAQFRSAHLIAELPYGPSHAETLDLYLPNNSNGPHPLWIFIHGGYWQAIDKAHNAHFAQGMLSAGYAVAMLNYALAPPANLADIVAQTQRALQFFAREATALGCDPTELHLSGHSAGGHLAALMACLPEGQLIRSCLPLSGLFDLAPLANLPMGRLLGFDTGTAIANLSPQHLRPLPHIHVGLAVGGLESAEFHRQSTDLAAAWGQAPCRIIAGKNHFDLLDGLNGGELLDFARHVATIGASPG